MVRAAIVFMIATLATGCILVQDVGDLWERGEIDRAILGVWKNQGARKIDDQYAVVQLAENGHHFEVRHVRAKDRYHEGMSLVGRTVQIGKHRFLLLRRTFMQHDENLEKIGFLFRYAVDDRGLASWAPNLDAIDKVLKNSSAEVRVEDLRAPFHGRFVTFAKLDPDAQLLLDKLCHNNELWARVAWHKVDDLKAELEASRAYPATAQTETNATVHVQLPHMSYFAGTGRRVLLRHLHASPRWRVRTMNKQLEIHRRELVDGIWTVPLPKPVVPELPAKQAQSNQRVYVAEAIHFEKTGLIVGPVDWDRDKHTVVAADAGRVTLGLRETDGRIYSTVAAGVPGFWYVVSENSPREARTQTRAGLQYMTSVLKVLKKDEHQVLQQGYSAQLMPPSSWQRGTASLHAEKDTRPGGFVARAWVNPEESGEIFLQAFRTADDQPLNRSTIPLGTREYAGWSKDRHVQFLYTTRFALGKMESNYEYAGRIELWFAPASGAPERKLLEKDVMIPGYRGMHLE